MNRNLRDHPEVYSLNEGFWGMIRAADVYTSGGLIYDWGLSLYLL